MRILIFDLDGTLVDTSKIVIPAFLKAFRHFPDVHIPSEKAMLDTFGMPEEQIWDKLMPQCPDDIRHEVQDLSSAYIQEGLVENDVLIDGARPVLEQLKKRGYILTVASNCSTDYLNGILDSQGIRLYFSFPLCLESVSGRKKADILKEHILRFGKTDCVMIGDRYSDIEAAMHHHIPAIGCDFGFGNSKELKDANQIIHNISELLEIFH